MKKILVLLTLFVIVASVIVARAATRTVSWGAVTQYTDNTPIEAGNAVTYTIFRQDSVTGTVVTVANRVTGTSATFDDTSLVKGRTYNFYGQAHLATGQSSDNSSVFPWLFPQGKASPPAGWVVQ